MTLSQAKLEPSHGHQVLGAVEVACYRKCTMIGALHA